MKKNGHAQIDLSPRRFLNNAKETLKKSEVDLGHYKDAKYVAEASGMAYLAALKAIYRYAEENGLMEKTNRPKSYEGVSHLINKFPNRYRLHVKFKSVYDILHTGGYYNEFTRASWIKDGFRDVEDIIKMLN